MDENLPAPRKSSSGANSVTYFALVGLCLVALSFLAFLGVLTSGILFFGVLGVMLGLGGMIAFHYVTWGWWLTKMRDKE